MAYTVDFFLILIWMVFFVHELQENVALLTI